MPPLLRSNRPAAWITANCALSGVQDVFPVLDIVRGAAPQTGTMSVIASRSRCCACTVRMVGLAGVSGAQAFSSAHGVDVPGPVRPCLATGQWGTRHGPPGRASMKLQIAPASSRSRLAFLLACSHMYICIPRRWLPRCSLHPPPLWVSSSTNSLSHGLRASSSPALRPVLELSGISNSSGAEIRTHSGLRARERLIERHKYRPAFQFDT